MSGARAVGDGQRDRGADLDVEDADVALRAGARPAPHVAAQVDHLDAIEALAHHPAQTRVGPAGQKLAVGDERHHAAPGSVLGLEQLPDGPAPERDRELGKRIELVALSCPAMKRTTSTGVK